MKISKLFHWLYAILMFLPIMVFIPNAFYYGFNEYAIAQEKTEQVPVYYETNDVESVTDLVDGNVYRLSVQAEYLVPDIVIIQTYDYFDFTYSYTLQTRSVDYQVPYILKGSVGLTLRINTDNTDNTYIFTGNGYLDFSYKEGTNIDLIIDYINICPKQYIKEYNPVTTNMSITDSMSYAWKTTWQNELFSWSYDSFLTLPFLYITNLFNVPPTNTLLYCLSYWLNISIIWLVFDVVLYVPLLVHRWLDKGIVE